MGMGMGAIDGQFEFALSFDLLALKIFVHFSSFFELLFEDILASLELIS